MKYLLVIEELAQCILAIIGLYLQSITLAWWVWPIVFLAPDISMVGYLINNRAGAILYNFFHHKAVAIILIVSGYIYAMPIILLIGLVLYGHSAMDRVFGYGLKYFTGFKHTHLAE